MAAWESLFAPGLQDTTFSFSFNTIDNPADISFLKCDEVTKLVSLDDIKAAKLNFSTIAKTYKAAHRNIEELEKKANVLHTKIAHIGSMKVTIEKQGIMARLNSELMLDEMMKPENYTELYTSLIKSETEILRNIDLKQSQYSIDLKNITLQIKENKAIIDEIEKIIKFVNSDVNIEELKVAPASITTVECGICKCAQVDHALRNCGHTFCKGCIDNLQSKCSYCNTPITDFGGSGTKALRIYFS